MKKNKIIALITAIFMALAAVVFGFVARPGKNIKTDVIIFGDSIIGNERTDTSVPALLQELCGMSVYNAGLGGTMMCASDDPTDRWGTYNMVNIAKAIEDDEFSVLLADIPLDYIRLSTVLDYADKTIKDIAHMDYSSVKFVIIEHGENDYLGGRPIGDEDYKKEDDTFCGALRTSIDHIRNAIPDAQIIVVSPGFSNTAMGPADTLDTGYGSLKDYVEAEEKVCREENVIFVDFYNDSGINRNNYESYLYDSLHLNEKGCKIMAQLIYEKMQNP